MNLRDKPIDDYVAAVQTSVFTSSGNNPQSIMAVVGRCTIELSDQAKQLSADINNTKTILGQRLNELTLQIKAAGDQASADINSAKQAFLPALAELVSELKRTRVSIAESGSATTKGTKALVRWTKVQVCVMIIYTLFAGGLLAVSFMQMRAATSLSTPTQAQSPATPAAPALK
jgi:hypothetical protein